MHMRHIASALAHLFERHGHDVSLDAAIPGRTGADYVLPLAAWHDGEWLLVDGDLSTPASEMAVHRLLMACIDTGARGIYCHAGSADAAARNACLDQVLLWDRETLALLLGQTQIADAMGEAPPRLSLGFPTPTPAEQNLNPVPNVVVAATEGEHLEEQPSEAAMAFAELMPPEPVREERAAESLGEVLPAAFQAVMAPLTPAPAAERELDWEASPAVAPASVATVNIPALQVLEVPSGSNGILAIKLSLPEAKQRVADRLMGWEQADLVLQPIHLFDYTVEVLQQGSLATDSKRGRIEINGTDRTVRPITDHIKLAGEAMPVPEASVTVMEKILRVNDARALQVATEWVDAQHSKTVRVASGDPDDEFALTELRRIAPTSGQVTLTPLGLWHRPFWRLWGDNGHVDIDAVDGAVLDEELRCVADSDAILIE